MENDDSVDFNGKFAKSTVMVKKARKAFMHFRSFNKCVTNCHQKKIFNCLKSKE